jgi:hypothetical protein
MAEKEETDENERTSLGGIGELEENLIEKPKTPLLGIIYYSFERLI